MYVQCVLYERTGCSVCTYRVYCMYVQGVPINMGINRPLEFYLGFPIVDKYKGRINQRFYVFWSFQNVVCLLCIYKIDGDIKHLKTLL